jgi:protein phosphatase
MPESGSQRMSQRSPLEFVLLSDVGLCRSHNQDACGADAANGLFVVCDGMGGAAGGEVASQIASVTFLKEAVQQSNEEPPAWRLHHAVAAANHAVYERAVAKPQLRGMGTTLVALEVDASSGTVWTVNVGDSRCYRLRHETLQLLTEDHSYVDEQVRIGALTTQEAQLSPLRNIITRAVGSHENVRPDVVEHASRPDDLYLLCSDGLTCELNDEEIALRLRSHHDDLQGCAQELIRLAKEHGGSDNITVVLIRIAAAATSAAC